MVVTTATFAKRTVAIGLTHRETRCLVLLIRPKTGPGGGFLETDPTFKRQQDMKAKDLKAHRCGTSRLWKPPPRTGSQLERRVRRAKCKAMQKETVKPVQIEGADIEWIGF